MTKIDYRSRAHSHLNKARTLIESGDDDILAYAALELRKCMEALTYERAQAYLEDLPPRMLASSQPQKLMEFILDLDPYADTTVSFEMSKEPAGTTAAPTFVPLGTEKPLTLRQIKDNYHKLGFYLHIPTIAQTRDGKEHDLARLRATGQEIIGTLDSLLRSEMWNLVLPRGTARIDCVRCGATIQRRLNALEEPGAPPAAKKTEIEVECFECPATYTLRLSTDRGVEWRPHIIDQPCQDKSCNGVIEMWEADLVAGALVDCPKCGKSSRLVLGLTPLKG